MTEKASIQSRVETATAVIRDAAALARSYFAQLSTLVIETKSGGQDVVSIADRDVETLIRDKLSAAFPQDGFLGEEYGLTEGSSGFTWVIDPIDGTACFVHDLPTWCVVIALVKSGETVAGLILDPNADELFSAVRGGGATLNGRPISVDRATDLQHGMVAIGASGRIPPRHIAAFVGNLLERGGMFVRTGSGALSLAHVACGRYAAYYALHMNAWDCIAAQCIIREAGGQAGDLVAEGGLGDGGMVVACAPQVHDALRAVIAASHAESNA